MPRENLRLSPQQTALFLFGIFFVTVMIILALAIPSPTEAQWRVFNLVLALVAGAIAAVLPGVLRIQFTPWLKSGGALAVFVLVYLVKPAGLVAADPLAPLPPPPAIELARPVVDRYLTSLDGGRYEEAYTQMHPSFKASYQELDSNRLLLSTRAPLGSVVQRTEVGQNSGVTVLPTGARGHVRTYMYATRFENAQQPIEEWVTVFAANANEAWSPFGYHINSMKANERAPSSK